MFSTLFNYSLIIGNCDGRLVSNSARYLDRVKTFGEVQKAFSTNATLFLSSLCDISFMKLLAEILWQFVYGYSVLNL